MITRFLIFFYLWTIKLRMISSFYNRIPNSFVVISRSLRNRVPLPARIRKSSKITLNSNKSSKLDSTEILNENIDSNLVHIKNSQRLFPIDEEEIRTQVKLIQRHLKIEDFGIDVWFCSDSKIRELNSEWREKKKSTDILSFPINDFIEPEVFADSFEQGVEKHLGDIVISPGYVYRQCKRDERDASVGDLYLNTDAGVSKAMSTVFDVNKRINLLLIHGILHLLGHDHEVSEDWKVMTTREDELIKRLHEMKV